LDKSEDALPPASAEDEIMANMRDISLATFNLYNLQLPGQPWRGTPYTEAEYAAKIAWSAQALCLLDADVVVFQELWSPQCLRDVFVAAQLGGAYEIVFLREEGWYDIAVALAVRKPWIVRARARTTSRFPRASC
jgi:hypothetical protein